jgi:hypothetical protein
MAAEPKSAWDYRTKNRKEIGLGRIAGHIGVIGSAKCHWINEYKACERLAVPPARWSLRDAGHTFTLFAKAPHSRCR